MHNLYKIETYGCQMNVHESEKIAGILESLGYSAAPSLEHATIVVFNTCCIRDTAEKKALGNIGAAKHLKEKNKNVIIAVVGCMTQQPGFATTFKQKYPYIDIVLGTSNLDKLEHHILDLQTKRTKIVDIESSSNPIIKEGEPTYRTSFPNAWVNIAYGCNNFCTYCIVPHVRGRERSRDKTAIVNEVKSLLTQGYKEITLLGQNVNSYGSDSNYKYSFYDLLSEIGDIDGKFRLRFMTSHPKDFSEKIVDIIQACDNISNYIHLPVQAGSNRILSAMNRRYTREHYIDIVKMIRERIPECGISSDIMVGFPTETEEEFAETLDLVEQIRFSTAFTFIYSPRSGTPAAELEQLPYSIKKDRIQRLIKLQNSITREESQKYLATIQEILIEDYDKLKPNIIMGRTASGRLVSLDGDKCEIGNFLDVKITKANSASLFGEKINGDK